MPWPKRNKYGAKPVYEGGVRVADSKAERAYQVHLELLAKAGEVTEIVKWPTVQLTRYVKWKLDFSHVDVATGETIYTDVKSPATQGGRVPTLKQLWKEFGPGRLQIAMYNYKTKQWMIKETKVDKDKR